MAANAELLTEQKASDPWAYSEAKTIRHWESEIALDLMSKL